MLFFVFIVSCIDKQKQMNALIIPMHWTSVDSLNAKLPEGIRLYAGQNDALPLRAWYVTIDEKHPDIVTRVVVSDDSTDNRETVLSFARDLNASVVVNGGYFTMNRTLAEHRGLLISNSAFLAPATVGAFEALNLDGGGSSTLVVANTLVNRPTGGTFQRQVMSAIATFSRSRK